MNPGSSPRPLRLAILSDVHYACPAEQARGEDYEHRAVGNPLLRAFSRLYRHYIWLRHPLRQNDRLHEFIAANPSPDLVFANGDYTCDTAFIGVADPAAQTSVRECLQFLRQQYGSRFHAIIGDHELGKLSMLGGNGGLRFDSLRAAKSELALKPFWQFEVGHYLFVGVTSTLLSLPLFSADLLPAEKDQWYAAAVAHLAQVRDCFARLRPDQKVILFCHDPSALPFLWRDELIRSKLGKVERTIIGHLHSRLVFRTSRILSGMPPIHFLGHTARRLSRALREARYWRPFKPLLCPSLAGVELLKDGGYLTATLDLHSPAPIQFHLHHLPR